MIENEDLKYDTDDKSIAERVSRSSSCYEPGIAVKQNLLLIEEYLVSGGYQDLSSLKAHMAYLSSLINQLNAIRQEESGFWTVNASLNFVIKKAMSLNSQLTTHVDAMEVMP